MKYQVMMRWVGEGQKLNTAPYTPKSWKREEQEKIQTFLCGENLKGAIKLAHTKASPQAEVEL